MRRQTNKHVSVEFRYGQRRRLNAELPYVAEYYGQTSYNFTDFVFDAILIVCYSEDTFWFLPYLENKYTGRSLLGFTVTGDILSFQNALLH